MEITKHLDNKVNLIWPCGKQETGIQIISQKCFFSDVISHNELINGEFTISIIPGTNLEAN